MGHKERIRRYRTKGGGAGLVRVEVLVPEDGRARIVGEAARLREEHRRGRNAAARDALLERLAPRYVWWPLEATGLERRRRLLAQVMNLGTYDDIRAVEAAFGESGLVDVMAHAEPGWFSPRSWSFWLGRLAPPAEARIPAQPPQRSFDDKAVSTGA